MADIENVKEQILDRIDYGTDVDLMMDVWELLRDYPQIVRCKDCKHGEPGACGDGIDCDGVWHDADWFCADGKCKDPK